MPPEPAESVIVGAKHHRGRAGSDPAAPLLVNVTLPPLEFRLPTPLKAMFLSLAAVSVRLVAAARVIAVADGNRTAIGVADADRPGSNIVELGRGKFQSVGRRVDGRAQVDGVAGVACSREPA